MVADLISRPLILVLTQIFLVYHMPPLEQIVPSHVKEAPNMKNFVAKLKKLKLSQDECRCNSCSN